MMVDYPSELRFEQQGPKAWSATCWAIRDSHSICVGEGYGKTELEAQEDAINWMVKVGQMAPAFWELEPEYHQAPLLGRKFPAILVACVAFMSISCAVAARDLTAPEIPPAPTAQAVAEVDVPQQSLNQIRESMKVLSNPGDEELARQFTVLRLLKDPCGIPKAFVFAQRLKGDWDGENAIRDYLSAFSEEDKYQAVQRYPMVGVSVDYLFSLMDH